jgi:hypothetical protein
MFLQDVSTHLPDCTVPLPKMPQYAFYRTDQLTTSNQSLRSRERAPGPAYVTSVVHVPQILLVVTTVARFKIFLRYLTCNISPNLQIAREPQEPSVNIRCD